MDFKMDKRYLAGNIKWYDFINENNMVATIRLERILETCDDEDEFLKLLEKSNIENLELEVPIMFYVCPICEGKGRYVNPDIDSNGLTYRDFEDYEFRENYFSGMYDIKCNECDGKRVVPEIDYDLLDEDMRQIVNYIDSWKEQRIQAKYQRVYELKIGY
jgi:hypothetical protein